MTPPARRASWAALAVAGLMVLLAACTGTRSGDNLPGAAPVPTGPTAAANIENPASS